MIVFVMNVIGNLKHPGQRKYIKEFTERTGKVPQINSETEQALARYENLLAFKKTDHLQMLLRLPHKTIGLFSGNQGGKTSNVAVQYFLRVIDQHPVKEKNRLAKKIRCMSSSLPESSSPEEQDNTQYLELKKIIPYEMIIKDITARSQNLVVANPTHGKTVFEFRSSKQELQDLGKIQLSSVWHDEETPKSIREECKMRLLAEDGDEIFSLTPVNPLSYTFDDIWEKASLIYRTKIISEKFNFPQIEKRNTGHDIACIQMATDDNPTLSLGVIERMFEDIDDPDEVLVRRYGIFKAISGRVHKTYDPKYCYINFQKTFPANIPYDWVHTRGIDYHNSRTPWSIGWVSASPKNEWFLWQEFHPSIDGIHAYNTREIAKAIIRKSFDYTYILNLIDPLASAKQPNTLFSVTDDMNRYFDELRSPAKWQGWDTKGTTGRDEISMRFKNAIRCGKPFNNEAVEDGRIVNLPTLWICDTCPKFHRSILNWRFGEYVTTTTKATRDPKPQTQERYSHDNMVLECLAKDQRLLYAAHFMNNHPTQIHRRHSRVTGG